MRARRLEEAVAELRRAEDLAPEEPRYAWVLGVALLETGAAEEGRRVLREAVERFPAYGPVAETLAALP